MKISWYKKNEMEKKSFHSKRRITQLQEENEMLKDANKTREALEKAAINVLKEQQKKLNQLKEENKELLKNKCKGVTCGFRANLSKVIYYRKQLNELKEIIRETFYIDKDKNSLVDVYVRRIIKVNYKHQDLIKSILEE